jgi:hypothetical protein
VKEVVLLSPLQPPFNDEIILYHPALISLRSVAVGQTFLTANLTEPDSLKRLIAHVPQDTSMVLLLVRLSSDYRFNKTDSSLIIAQEAIQLSQKLNFTKGEIRALSIAGEACRFQGEFPRALEYQFNALKSAGIVMTKREK